MWQTIDVLQNIKESFECWRAALTLYYIDTDVKGVAEISQGADKPPPQTGIVTLYNPACKPTHTLV